MEQQNNWRLKDWKKSKEWNTHSIFACKLAATGFNGVELKELNLFVNEVGETPPDNFTPLSGIFVLCSRCNSYGRS